MKHIFPLSAILSILLTLGCVPEAKRGNTFEASFTLNTPIFYDGEQFSFTVRSNRDAVKVTDFYFLEKPNIITTNSSYRLSDGVWTFTDNVPVKESRRGRFSITIQDPVTGDTRTFSETYTAYASTSLRLKIENSIVRSTNIKEDLPLVVGGENFDFTVYSKAERLILKDYKCKFDADKILVRDSEYQFKDGIYKFSIPKVRVDEDGFEEASSLSLTFHNPETERDTTINAEYIYAMAFEPKVSINPSSIMEEDIITAKFEANRRTFKLTSFAVPTWFKFENLYNGTQLTLGAEGYVEYKTSPVSLDESASGEVFFLLSDDAYTKREVLVRCSYKTTEKPDPQSVIIDNDSFLVNSDEVFLINVSTKDSYSTNKFHASTESATDAGKVLFYSPGPNETITDVSQISSYSFKKEVDITSGKLYVKAGTKAGTYNVKINAFNRPNVYKTASVSIRQDIALRLTGTFYEYVSTDPANELGRTFFNQPYTQYGENPVGWHGFPSSIYADLVTYSTKRSNILDVNNNDFGSEVSTSVVDYSTSTTPFEIILSVEVGDYVTSNGMFAGYSNVYSNPYFPGETDPRYYLWLNYGKDGQRDKNGDRRVYTTTMPPSIKNQITEPASMSSHISCTNLLTLLKNMDCYHTWQYATGRHYNITETHQNGYRFVHIRVKSVRYDESKYHLKYIFSLFEANGFHGSAMPWWAGLDTNYNTVEEYNPENN